jgi:AcrR family transcriptional regulator
VAGPSTLESSRPFHHGNLPKALVEAALALLGETQAWDFSLREVARRAGVSHNAPYKHFPEKRDLLTAVAAKGFELLADLLQSAADSQTNPRLRLIACARAYVAHAVANPALYRLMFGAALTSAEAGRPMREKQAAAKARAILDLVIADLARDGQLPSSLTTDMRALASASLAVWSMLHGLAMLAIDDFVGPPEKVATLVDPLIGALLAGLAARPPAAPADIWIAPRL